MRKNFTIDCFTALVVDGRAIALYNFYRPVSIGTSLDGDSIALTFRCDREWSEEKEAEPETVTITWSGNLRIAFNDLIDAPIPLRTDSCEIAYYNAGCDWDQMLDEELADAHGFEGLHFCFCGGLILRIRADVAEVTTG